jgi:hypothetical protein
LNPWCGTQDKHHTHTHTHTHLLFGRVVAAERGLGAGLAGERVLLAQAADARRVARDLLGKQTISQLSGLTAGDWSAVLRDLVFGIIYVILLTALWRKEGGLKSPWVLYSFLMLVVPLASGSVTSLARLGLLAWPLAWPMAEWLGKGGPTRMRWVTITALVVIALMVAQLSTQAP